MEPSRGQAATSAPVPMHLGNIQLTYLTWQKFKARFRKLHRQYGSAVCTSPSACVGSFPVVPVSSHSLEKNMLIRLIRILETTSRFLIRWGEGIHSRNVPVWIKHKLCHHRQPPHLVHNTYVAPGWCWGVWSGDAPTSLNGCELHNGMTQTGKWQASLMFPAWAHYI